jgi:hypothetical protein
MKPVAHKSTKRAGMKRRADGIGELVVGGRRSL